jgi:hypothetical protein
MSTPSPVSETEPLALTSEQKSGRVILVLSFSLWLIAAIVVSGLIAVRFGATLPFTICCVRIAIVLGLFYAVWRGQSWARWLTVGLFTLGSLKSLFDILAQPSLLLILTSFACLAVVASLAFTKNVGSFLLYQQTRK